MMRIPIAAVALLGCAAPDDLSEQQLALTASRELRRGDQLIARDVADPRTAPDGRIAFTQLPPGRDIAPDTVGKLVVVDLARGTRRVVVDDPHASNPFPVPGSDDVLFVSSRSGLAALYLARPGRAPRQLTNVGLRDARDPRFVPVPGRELIWQGRTAVFTATYGGVASRWSLDLDTGRAEVLP